jgi:hypothetical protein
MLCRSFIHVIAGRTGGTQFPMSVAIEWLRTAHCAQQQESVIDSLPGLSESELQFRKLNDCVGRRVARPPLMRLNR